jgi:radical SAM protein with 4Fe4S-binding SPASM domain
VNTAPPLPKELQLEITGACNLACRMCLVRYRPKVGRRTGAMCFHTFKELVDAVPLLERLTLQGLGEPLLAPDLFRMLEYAAERGIRAGFNTNGTLLTRPISERLVALGVDWLHVSLDGATAETYEGIRDGSDFARVNENVRNLVDVMQERRAVRPTLQLVFVAMRRNLHELPHLVRLAAEWGIGRVWVQNLSHSFSDTDPSGSYREIRDFAAAEALWRDTDRPSEALFQDARDLADELGVELRLPRLHEPPAQPRQGDQPGCHWPFESAYVTHDGNVQPCCMVMGADRAVLGRLQEADFATIWRGAPYRGFRERLLGDATPPDVCQGCSLYRRVF